MCAICSGSFADVVKGELKIKCAVKRMRPLPQQEVSQLVNAFVREGEMMRVASGVRMCEAVPVIHLGPMNKNSFITVWDKRPDLLARAHVSPQLCESSSTSQYTDCLGGFKPV